MFLGLVARLVPSMMLMPGLAHGAPSSFHQAIRISITIISTVTATAGVGGLDHLVSINRFSIPPFPLSTFFFLALMFVM